MKTKQLVTSLVFGLGLILSLLWLMTGRSILPIYADTYNVTNTNDSGTGSLHQAISDSNIKAGPDINFSNFNTGVVGVDIQSTEQAFTPTWATERIGFSKTFGRTTDRSLVLDSSNYPHIAYGGDHLYYAWYDGSTWYKETVDPAWGVGWYTSIDLDSDGNPHISYYDDINHNLKYAYYDGMEWNIEVVDSDGDVGKHTSIALDALDYPHISYYDDTNGSIRYAYYSSSAWHIQTVDNTISIRTDSTSLALDSSGNPHVSYGRTTTDELRYAHWTGSVWVTETVDSEVGWYSSLDLDNNDYPHIAYVSNINFDNYDLMYARWTGSVWVTETVDSDANGAYPSIVLDASDNPHIAYHSSLRYARWGGAAWVTETIRGESADSLSLALDTTGNPHIANYQVSSMRYIHWTGSAWNSQTVDNSRKVGESASLALAPTAPYTPHISYATGDSLEYATYNGGRWVMETIESVEIHSVYGGGTSLALAPTVPHTIYISYACRDGGLRYGYRTSSGWITETVDSYAYGAYRVSLALVPTAPYTLHIAYLDDGDVKYAHRTKSGWVIEAVDYDTDVWGGLDGVSLAIAPVAPYTPLISYHDAESGYVRFARRIDSEWVTETIAYSMNSSGNTSLAVDSLGNPHVAYDEWGNYYLRYAHWTGTEWDIEKVDHSGQPSLALDKNDQPRIGYYREGLLYAYRDSGAWITETVDNLGNVGQGVSLALDGEDHPRIAYYDNSNGDLKFAWRERVDVVPTSGGVVGAYRTANFEFPSGTFTDTVVFTYTALQPSASQPHVGVFFDISAIYASSGERAQVASGQAYTVTVHYDEANVPPDVDEADLVLYYWNEGTSTWIKEPTSVVDIVNNTITATPNHFSVWAGLFEIATDIEKQVVPQGQVDYGDELTYTLIISAATGTQLGLYDPMTETNFLRFAEQPDGIECVDNVITGMLEVPPANRVTVSFVAQVGVPGTVGWKTDVTNRACVYPSAGTVDDNCIWSDEVINEAYHPYKIFLPLVIRNS